MRPMFPAAAAMMFGIGRAFCAANVPDTLSEQATRWWQWRVSLPELAVPDRDPAGHFCDVGQSGDSWFLGSLLTTGTMQKPIRRTCVVPSGRRLFFPALTALRIVNGEVTCGKATAQVSNEVGRARDLRVTLDGASLPVTPENRWTTAETCIPLKLRADGSSAGLVAAVGGYWMTIMPLTSGRHSLSFGGVFGPTGDARETLYELDVR